MKTKTEPFTLDLINRTNQLINRVKKFKKYSLQQLNFKENKEKWSVLECIEHLNLYSEFYNPEIRKSIESSNSKPTENYKSGLLGNYFANSMLPKEKLNTIKTFKDKNPNGRILDLGVLEQFIAHQKEFIELIKLSKNVNLSKTRTAISISKIIRLKLGDTFSFNVAHNERHIKQAEKATIN